MRKDTLRLIYQKRFKIMNRWNSRAAPLQPKFGAVADPAFRSFVFHAFEELAALLRKEDKESHLIGPSLLDKVTFSSVPDLKSYLRALEMGGEVLDSFVREDPLCLKRFDAEARDEAAASIRTAVAVLLSHERVAYEKRWPPEKGGVLYCIQCGRPFEG